MRGKFALLESLRSQIPWIVVCQDRGKQPTADEARGQRNGRPYRIASQLGEFSLVKKKGGVYKEDTKIIIYVCHYVCQGKQGLVQLSRQPHQLPVCRQEMKETNTDRP
jgi:uncharacterized protein YcfJ